MSVEEIKREIAALSQKEQAEISAFLFHIRQNLDPDYQTMLNTRLSDRNSENWLTPEEFERRLDEQ